jgi:hypothetical protein
MASSVDEKIKFRGILSVSVASKGAGPRRVKISPIKWAKLN